MTVEWYNCPKCGRPCSVKPLSKAFDPEGKKFGGIWFCQTCRIDYLADFLTYEQIQELKNTIVPVERIEQQEGNNIE